MSRPAAARRPAGFTLIELVIVIVLLGILAVTLSQFITAPVKGYIDTSRRAALVDTADTALNRMTREIRLALPNSVRVSGNAIEFLRIRTGGRYRGEPDPGDPASDPLEFAATLSPETFDVLGELPDWAAIQALAGAGRAECLAGTVDCLVIYNTGQPCIPGQPCLDAYQGGNVAGIDSATATRLGFSPAGAFPLRSPAQRFYVVDTPVSFVCDPGAGTVRRHDGYPIAPAQLTTDAALTGAGASSQLLVDRVSACSFSYVPGTATRSGLVTLELAISEAGETVSLLQQVHVENLP